MNLTKLGKEMAAIYDSQPNVRKYLGGVQKAEGGAYDKSFSGVKITDFTKHPNIQKAFLDRRTGKMNTSGAAGAYQIIKPTWDEIAPLLGLTDFSPRSQDIAATYLLNRRKALTDVIAGDFGAAIQKTNKEWASLPGSPYQQKTRSLKQMATYLGVPEESLGASVQTGADAVPPQRQPELTEDVLMTNLANEGFTTPSIVDVANPKTPANQLRDVFSGIMPASQNTMPSLDENEGWEDALLERMLLEDANNARNSAVTSFLTGNPAPERLVVPPASLREINKIIASL